MLLVIKPILTAKGKRDVKVRQVTFEEAKKFADEHSMNYIETSATSGMNIKLLFETITSCLYESHNFPTNKDRTIVLDQPTGKAEKEAKGKCCKSSA